MRCGYTSPELPACAGGMQTQTSPLLEATDGRAVRQSGWKQAGNARLSLAAMPAG